MARLASARRHDGGGHGDGDEEREDEQRLPFAARRKQQRHGEHGAQLAPGAEREDGRADARVRQAALLEDGQQRAECRGGKRNGHGDAVEMAHREVGGKAHGDESEHDAHHPGDKAAFALRSRECLGVDLVAGKQEQKRESELGEQIDRFGGLNDAGEMRAEQGACDEQEHGFGNEFAGNETRDDRADERHKGDDGERGEFEGHGAPSEIADQKRMERVTFSIVQRERPSQGGPASMQARETPV